MNKISMRLKVIANYESENLDPIELVKGDKVTLGEESDLNGPMPNWIYCTSERTGKDGWTPTDILIKKGGVGVATCAYSAKEMTVAAGDIVDAAYELNGWLWCKRICDSEEGWVEKGNLEEIV